jgi:hypothetical protein
LGFTSICLHIYRFIKIQYLINELDSNSFVSFERIADFDEISNHFNAITLFFSYMKLFKYVTLNRRLNQLNVTLGRCAKDLCSFLIIFFVFFFAYGSLTYLMFGSKLIKFGTFSNTL